MYICLVIVKKNWVEKAIYQGKKKKCTHGPNFRFVWKQGNSMCGNRVTLLLSQEKYQNRVKTKQDEVISSGKCNLHLGNSNLCLF